MYRRPTQDMGKLKCIDWRCEVESKDLVSLKNLCRASLRLDLMLYDFRLSSFSFELAFLSVLHRQILSRSLCLWACKLMWQGQHTEKVERDSAEVIFATSTRKSVLESRIALKCFDTNMYPIRWTVQSSKNGCDKNSPIHSSIHSAFSVFSHSAGPWIFRPVVFSSESLFFLLLAEYHWNGLLRAVQCCFSSSQLRVRLNAQIPLLPDMLGVSFLHPLVTAYWWNKQFLKTIKIFNTFSPSHLCVLCFVCVQYFSLPNYVAYKYRHINLNLV